MSESKGKGGSWLYGILLILSGAFILVMGILNILGFNPIAGLLPSEFSGLVGISGYRDLVIGAWGIIGGVGLIKDQEWGWGVSLVVLSVVIVLTITNVITGIMAVIGGDLTGLYTITFWLYIVPFIIAVVGIIYLLATKYKYA
jgi:hypothetical protein